MVDGEWNSVRNRNLEYWGGPVDTGKLKSTKVGDRQLYYSVHFDENFVDVPIMIYFHSWSGTPREETFIEQVAQKMIVVQPWDNFGFNRQGCWWLGEAGEFFMFELLDAMLADLRTLFPQSKGLYTCGRSMGGFGSLLHALRMQADGVYTEIPQCNLYRMYGDIERFPPYLENIFGFNGEHEQGDLVHQYRIATSFPKRINIVHNRWDINTECDEPFRQTIALVNVLVERGVTFYMEVPPTIGHQYITPLDSIADLLLA